MKEPKFEYGPLAHGIYHALISLTLVVPLINYKWTLWYILFLIFLGFGLRPLLEKTGLYDFYAMIRSKMSDRMNKKWIEERRRQIEIDERNKKLRHSRLKDPRLPKDW